MPTLVQPRSPDEWRRFCALPGLSPLTPEVCQRHGPDASWLLADGGEPAARCSLWWNGTPPHDGHRLGLIGHYAAREAGAAAELLGRACVELEGQGCTLAVGPMDGNTWRRYRLLTSRGNEPLFFLEPDNPDDWPAHFTDNGFGTLAEYSSALNGDLRQRDPRADEAAARLAERGIRLRPMRPDHFEQELRDIYALSLLGFQKNFLYTPLAEEEFVEQYRGLRSYLRPELTLLAECDGALVGFLLAVPDLFQARRGGAIDTVILKSMAVHPDHGGAGLGALLMARCQEEAARLGYRRAIHALMHEANRSRRISDRTAQTIRRYTLFARPLGPRP
jgi:GNAT superfamily N-acetyltransferase